MSQSIRHVWPDPFRGIHWLNVNLPGVVIATIVPRPLRRSIDGRVFVQYTHDIVVSAVVVTVCEWGPTDVDAYSDPPIGSLHRGDAAISVSNVRPYVREYSNEPAQQGGGVEFVINVDYSEPLFIATTITVFDELPRMSR
jgi:hypothetical protein